MIVDFGEYGSDEDGDEDQPLDGGPGSGRPMGTSGVLSASGGDDGDSADHGNVAAVEACDPCVDEDAVDAFLNESVTAVASPANLSERRNRDYDSDDDDEDDDDDSDEEDEGASAVSANGDAAGSITYENEEDLYPTSQHSVRDESEKRRAIQSIMRDRTLTEPQKRVRIQQIMDGRRAERAADTATTTNCETKSPPSPHSERKPSMASTDCSQGPDWSDGGTGTPRVSLSPTNVPKCMHYERRCQIVSPCCDKVFGCRICHDERTEDHGPLDRFTIREVVCKVCSHRQPSTTNECVMCKTKFAEYHCQTCNLWMSESTKPFHCDSCGICRVGGCENYVHCDACCMCLSTTVYANHKCINEKFKNNCPVCQENLFSSRQAPQDLPCGHAIHLHCFRTLASFDYRCPVCKKTIVSQTTMATAWLSRAREIAAQPMPPDLVRVVSIICNDCGERSDDRLWHFLGVQCPGCSSFNTVVENMSNGEDPEHTEHGEVANS